MSGWLPYYACQPALDSVPRNPRAIIQPIVLSRERNVVKVETEILDDRQARIVATVEQEQVDKEMKAAARRIAKHVNIPGFRKGKAPYGIIQQYYGEEAILEEALEELGQNVYREALVESGIEPYAPGSLDGFEREPFTMTFTVPLIPEVDLGEYRDVRVDYEEPEVNEEDVEQALEELRDQVATLDPVERAIEMGDVALLDIKGVLDREPDEEDPDRNDIWLNRADVRVKITEEATYPVPGFPEKVVGMAAGDEREFEMSFDEDEELADALRGKTLHFDVKCNEVYEYNVPEFDDEFAKEVGEFDTFEELRADIRQQLEELAESRTRDEYINELLTKFLDDEIVQLSYPPIMVDEQIHRMLEDFDQELRQQGLNLEEYKKLQNVTDEQLHEDLHEEAVRQLQNALILGEVAEAEELGVTDAEIDAGIEEAVKPYGGQAALARQLFSSPAARNSMANRVLAQKTLDRLVAIARGEEPPIGEPEPEEEEVVATADAGEVAEVEAELEAATKASAAAQETAAEEEAAEENPPADSVAEEAEAMSGEVDEVEDVEPVVSDGSEAPGTSKAK